MAIKGHIWPMVREHDYLGTNGWPQVAKRQYQIVDIDYNAAWAVLPPVTRLPLPILLKPIAAGPAAGTLHWQSVIQVPIIRPAFFIQLDWEFFKAHGPWSAADDVWRMGAVTTTGFAVLTQWRTPPNQDAVQGTFHANNITANADASAYQITGLRYEAVPY